MGGFSFDVGLQRMRCKRLQGKALGPKIRTSEDSTIKGPFYCRVKELNSLGPLHIELKAHAKEEETSEDEQRESILPRDIAEDNPILGQLRS